MRRGACYVAVTAEARPAEGVGASRANGVDEAAHVQRAAAASLVLLSVDAPLVLLAALLETIQKALRVKINRIHAVVVMIVQAEFTSNLAHRREDLRLPHKSGRCVRSVCRLGLKEALRELWG